MDFIWKFRNNNLLVKVTILQLLTKCFKWCNIQSIWTPIEAPKMQLIQPKLTLWTPLPVKLSCNDLIIAKFTQESTKLDSAHGDNRSTYYIKCTLVEKCSCEICLQFCINHLSPCHLGNYLEQNSNQLDISTVYVMWFSCPFIQPARRECLGCPWQAVPS